MSQELSQKTPTRQLTRIRNKLGPLVVLDYSALSLEEAHYRLGREVAQQVHRWLTYMSEKFSTDRLEEAIRAARRFSTELKKKIQDDEIALAIREALADYNTCLAAWSRGAALDEFLRKQNRFKDVDGEPVSSLELAFMLQIDLTGCQTGVIRTEFGNVVLWHTEEEIEEKTGSRFDSLRLVVLNVSTQPRSVKAYAFLYPDLLPGLAFAWRTDGFVQALDALIVKPQAGAIPASVAAWVLMRIGPHLPSEKIVSSLAPYVDGYAVTTVTVTSGSVEACKIEFAGQLHTISQLTNDTGSMLFQVNVFSDPKAPITLACEGAILDGRDTFEKRIERTKHTLSKLIPEKDLPATLFKLLCSVDGGSYAYANQDVKAYLICQVFPKRLEVWLGTGPASKRLRPNIFVVEW